MDASDAKTYGATEPAPEPAKKKWGRREVVAAALLLASTAAVVAYAAPSAAPGLRGATEMVNPTRPAVPLCDDGASALVITGPAVDTNIFEEFPHNAFGIDYTDLTVDRGADVQALLKFSLDFKQVLGGLIHSSSPCDVEEAWLYLYTNSASEGIVSGYRMNVAWDAPPLGPYGKPTWASVSADGGVQESQHRDTATFTLGAPEDEKWAKVDVTKDVQAWKAGEPNNGWVFKIDSSDGWDFDSSETSSGPVLVVKVSDESDCDPQGKTTSIEEYCLRRDAPDACPICEIGPQCNRKTTPCALLEPDTNPPEFEDCADAEEGGTKELCVGHYGVWCPDCTYPDT